MAEFGFLFFGFCHFPNFAFRAKTLSAFTINIVQRTNPAKFPEFAGKQYKLTRYSRLKNLDSNLKPSIPWVWLQGRRGGGRGKIRAETLGFPRRNCEVFLIVGALRGKVEENLYSHCRRRTERR